MLLLIFVYSIDGPHRIEEKRERAQGLGQIITYQHRPQGHKPLAGFGPQATLVTSPNLVIHSVSRLRYSHVSAASSLAGSHLDLHKDRPAPFPQGTKPMPVVFSSSPHTGSGPGQTAKI